MKVRTSDGCVSKHRYGVPWNVLIIWRLGPPGTQQIHRGRIQPHSASTRSPLQLLLDQDQTIHRLWFDVWCGELPIKQAFSKTF